MQLEKQKQHYNALETARTAQHVKWPRWAGLTIRTTSLVAGTVPLLVDENIIFQTIFSYIFKRSCLLFLKT